MTMAWGEVFSSLVTWWTRRPDVTPAEMVARCRRLFAAAFGGAAPRS